MWCSVVQVRVCTFSKMCRGGLVEVSLGSMV